jgi:heme exporter protein C
MSTRRSPFLTSLRWLLLVAMVVNLYLVFVWVPTEKTMGIVQRIFYFHVPSAWTAFLAFGIVFVYSLLYLIRKQRRFDTVAEAAAEVGVLFTTIVLITGPLWARPVWNTWWSWDPRLTLTLVLWLIYIAYLMLRGFVPDKERAARFAAVFGIVGFLDVPLVYMSIRWWRTIHPKPVIMGGQGSGLDSRMWTTLLFSFFTLLVLFAVMVLARVRLQRMREDFEELKMRALYGDAAEQHDLQTAPPERSATG